MYSLSMLMEGAKYWIDFIKLRLPIIFDIYEGFLSLYFIFYHIFFFSTHTIFRFFYWMVLMIASLEFMIDYKTITAETLLNGKWVENKKNFKQKWIFSAINNKRSMNEWWALKWSCFERIRKKYYDFFNIYFLVENIEWITTDKTFARKII